MPMPLGAAADGAILDAALVDATKPAADTSKPDSVAADTMIPDTMVNGDTTRPRPPNPDGCHGSIAGTPQPTAWGSLLLVAGALLVLARRRLS